MPASSTLHLSFESGRNGSTILRVKRQEPPWKVVRGFQTPSGETLAHLHNVSGGILDGDSLECRIELTPGAQAQVTTTGATRLYRSRSKDRTAAQRSVITVGERAYLEYLPDQLIPFASARFEQSARVQLDDGASLIWWDIVAPGREASGEIFQYESLAGSLELTACGERIAVERWTIAPLLRSPAANPRLGPFHHFASCYVCRAGDPTAYWRKLEAQLERLADRLSGPEVLWGVTSLKAHGLVFRGVAVRGRSLSEGLVEVWKAAKWALCGRAATIPRKVH
jgi:urease accessory protein